VLTLTDLFAGAGGSSTGAIAVPGVEVRLAANHWELAVEVHNSNHPGADHLCADISMYDPRRVPRTDLLWASPECTNHSRAQGRRRVDSRQPDLFGEVLPVAAADRSRATMWDVVRFSEAHRYDAVIVENVVEAVQWEPFDAWLLAMGSLGYLHRVVSLNSMHAQDLGSPAPQSRDRIYVVFWRKGNPVPDVDAAMRPHAWCPRCDRVVESQQAWKNGRTAGRYRQQYVYLCPTDGTQVEPGWLPAAAAIDWSLPGTRIGDRTKPLADKTRARIAVGIARYWQPIHLEAAGHTYDAADPAHKAHGDPNGYYRAWPVSDPLKALHATGSKALAIPFVAELRGGGSTARSVDDPMATVTASGNHHALVAPYYGASETAKPASEALGTVTTVDRFALITRMNNNRGDQSNLTTPIHETLRTLTTAGHQAILTPGDMEAARARVDDCLFRMLEPHEVAAGMAFPAAYLWSGTRRERVRMAGNAVTPPAARDLIGAVAATLGGAA
jgi:DNA (cytosine-5)-methyltransferase 1